MTARLPFAARRDPCELAEPDLALAVLAELRALRCDVALLLARGGPADALVTLLPLIHNAIGDAVWSAADVSALALLPGRDALAAALAPLVRGRGLRSFGKALARGAGRDLGGYRLMRVGADRSGALWLVRRL